MKKQAITLADVGPDQIEHISTLGLNEPDGRRLRSGGEWTTELVCRQQNFSLVLVETYRINADCICYTSLDDYVKVSFWLSGQHTTVLDGFGQCDHGQAEIFVAAAPEEMIKADLMRKNSRMSMVALCVLKEFFPESLGISADELPEPLKWMFVGGDRSPALCRYPFTPSLLSAARAILSAPWGVLRDPVYVEAKSIELMCLLLDLMRMEESSRFEPARLRPRHIACLQRAREIIGQRFSESLTIGQLSKEVGLNRLALTNGFRKLFNMSISECLQQERMEHALRLLHEGDHDVNQVAQKVGFAHPRNFSTAFHEFYGYPPRQMKGRIGRP